MPLQKIKNVTDLKGKRVLVRLDLDVPINEKGKVIEGEDIRLQYALPTLRYLIKNGAEITLMGHRGRPNGRMNKELSLIPVVERLAQLLGGQFYLKQKRIGDFDGFEFSVGKKIISVIENIRFYSGEIRNSARLGKALATFGDIYVNEAFGVSHREHASLCAVTNFLPSYAGIQMVKEIETLMPVIKKPKRPLTLIIGGVKAKTKLKLIEKFIPRADYILIGSALANNFYKELGFQMGKSVMDKQVESFVQNILDKPKYRILDQKSMGVLLDPKRVENIDKALLRELQKRIILPVDVVVSEAGKVYPKGRIPSGDTKVVDPNKKSLSPKAFAVFDIGERTIMLYKEIIKRSQTIVWNGPMGWFEQKPFNHGTYQIAQEVAGSKGKSIVGGGDTVASVMSEHIPFKQNTFISTGGGAMLEFLIDPKLPAIKPLIRR